MGSAGQFTLAVALSDGHVGSDGSEAIVCVGGELGDSFVNSTSGVEAKAE